MTRSATTLDLTEVLTVLDAYRDVAEIARRQGLEAHLRMLDAVDRIRRGRPCP